MAATVNESLEGHKVRVTYLESENKQPIEGKAEAVSGIGVLLKVKGKASTQLILLQEIKDVELIEDSNDVQQSVLQPVSLKNVRRHLVSNHGWLLSQVNKLGDDEALEQHNALHAADNAADLGHRHEAKAPKDKSGEAGSPDQPTLTEE